MLTAGLRAGATTHCLAAKSARAPTWWEPIPALVVKGRFGHAFKAPTLKQISPNYVGAEGPHTFAGNGNIKPESSNSFEVGADWQVAPASVAARATVFNTEVKDLITYRLLRQEGVRRFYQYDNVDAARIQGLEAGMTWDMTRQLAWSNDLTLLHTRQKHRQEAGRPAIEQPDLAPGMERRRGLERAPDWRIHRQPDRHRRRGAARVCAVECQRRQAVCTGRPPQAGAARQGWKTLAT